MRSKGDTKITPYVFVYGTLMRGLWNHAYMGESKFIGSATTEENYTLKVGAFSSVPFLTKEPSDTYVRGELYKVSEETLELVDRLESHPTGYTREVVNVISDEGEPFKAWVYFNNSAVGNHEHLTVIESGDYKEHMRKKEEHV